MIIHKLLVLSLFISVSSFGEIRPVPLFIEDDVVVSKLYADIEEQSFGGLSKEDRLFTDCFSAYARKDMASFNSFFIPEFQMRKKTFDYLSKSDFGSLDTVTKSQFDSYLCYHATTSKGELFACYLPTNIRELKFGSLTNNFVRGVLSMVNQKRTHLSHPLEMSKYESITFGTKHPLEILFEFHKPNSPISLTLSKSIKSLNSSYKKKNLDTLPDLITKESLERIMTGMMNGTPDPRFRICSFESVGVISMDPVYVYLGHRENEESLFFRKFLKKDDKYLLFNYLGGGGPLETFLESDEFKIFALKKYNESYPNNSTKDKKQKIEQGD